MQKFLVICIYGKNNLKNNRDYICETITLTMA